VVDASVISATESSCFSKYDAITATTVTNATLLVGIRTSLCSLQLTKLHITALVFKCCTMQGRGNGLNSNGRWRGNGRGSNGGKSNELVRPGSASSSSVNGPGEPLFDPITGQELSASDAAKAHTNEVCLPHYHTVSAVLAQPVGHSTTHVSRSLAVIAVVQEVTFGSVSRDVAYYV
jgi:hypothetical protein